MQQPFLTDVQNLKPGLIIFRRSDVQHRNWYGRVKVPKSRQYKTVSLKTPDINIAKEMAYDLDAEIRILVKRQIPVFDKSFADVALEYSSVQERKAKIKQITLNRWKTIDGHIRLHLIPYMGNMQITSVTEDKWTEYPFWRKENNAPEELKKSKLKGIKLRPKKQAKDEEPEEHKPCKDGTIVAEMMTYRAIMRYAARKQYIRESMVPKGDLPEDSARREAFTAPEYRALHTKAREWIKESNNPVTEWYRKMTYNFMLIMANTGMRNSEARNLRWRDIDMRKTKDGRSFVVMNVRGKKKYRELIAASNVATYLERIRELFIESQLRRNPKLKEEERGPKPDDAIFTTAEGKASTTLYDAPVADLLEFSGLLISSNGSRRSTYCFRHTYATFRLSEGVDVYFLAKQMGTSVQMIEDYYGHVTPAKNAERILQGIPEWEPLAEEPGEKADSVNAGAAGKEAKKPRKK
jgi:integrase